MNKYNKYEDSILILQESSNPSFKEVNRIINVLEDAESPLNAGYIRTMMESIEDTIKQGIAASPETLKIHKSSGNIDNIKEIFGSEEICNIIKNESQANGYNYPLKMVNGILELIENVRQYRDVYQRGYATRCNYVITEYSMLVVFIITSTSVVLNSFCVPTKTGFTIEPNYISGTMKSAVSAQKLMDKFNKVFADTQTNHRKFLESLIMKETDNFIGSSTALGVGVVAAAAIAVIPLTRELVYQFYKLKSSLSDCLAQQAYFLELNKASVESNTAFTPKKRADIIKRQEKVKNLFLKLSSKLRVDHIKATSQSKQMLDRDNKMMTLDNIKQDIDQSSLQLF